jgi:hypothetical protein
MSTSLLTDCDLDAMRATVSEHFAQRATIQRQPLDTSDGMGGQVDAAPIVVATNVPCSAWRASAKEQESVRHITTVLGWTIQFVGGIDVRMKDKVVVDGRVFILVDVKRRFHDEVVIPAFGIEAI